MRTTRRALRRHHRERMIQRALRSFAVTCGVDEEWHLYRALRHYDNLKKCSCWMCGNPRKYRGKPRCQVQRLLQAARDEAETA